MQAMGHFLYNLNIVMNFLIFYKGELLFTYKILEVQFHFVHNHLRKDFVDDIAHGERSVILYDHRVSDFSYKYELSRAPKVSMTFF